MKYLTQTHETPPKHVQYGDNAVIPTQALINANDYASLASAGIYRHITVAGQAPLGYTDWTLKTDAEGDYYEREPAGTEAEREEAGAANAVIESADAVNLNWS